MKSKKSDRKDEIYVEYISLSELAKWPRNPKLHDTGMISKSIGRFGFVNPILIDERSGKIVAGHGRLEILQQMQAEGQAPPERIQEDGNDWKAPIIRGLRFNSDSEAEAYLVADNKLVELGGWDDQSLSEILKDLSEQGEDAFDGLGFNQVEIEALTSDKSDSSNVEFPEYDETCSDDIKKIKCPQCNHEFAI